MTSILKVGLWTDKDTEENHSLAFTYFESPEGVIVEIEKPPLTGEGWKDDIYAALKERFGLVSTIKYNK
jgi:hypothetical protein